MSKVVVSFCLLAIVVPTAFAEEKNIVLFVADDLSQTLGCYGDANAVTPSVDAFAKEAVVFEHAFATTASCSASRSVILTGLHNHATGQYGHMHNFHKFNAYDNVLSLPNVLNAAGFRTAICGKFHVAPESLFHFQTKIAANQRNAVEMADRCKDFISEDDERPFFLYIATSDPHRGGGMANEIDHAPDRFGNPKPGKSYPGVDEVRFEPTRIHVPDFLPDTPATRAELAQYYQSVARVDQGFGRLIEHLKSAGKWESTLIMFLSDHGMAFAGAKTTVYEPGLRSPFIVRHPGVESASVISDALISWTDITPTLLDYAGILVDREIDPKILEQLREASVTGQRNRNLNGAFHGRSILPILADQRTTSWDTVFASHTFHEITMYYPMRVIRRGKYKLIWNIAHGLPYPFASDLWRSQTWQVQYRKGKDAPYGKKSVDQYIHRPKFELYDLGKDPSESTNLIDDPAFAKVAEELKSELKEFQRETNDPWISKWNYE